jgi:hypothetical protein
MGGRDGLSGLIDRLRYDEIARQSIGLLLLLVCAWFVAPGPMRILVGLLLALVGQAWRVYSAGVIYKNRQLAKTGAYSLVRHPLYLGNVIILGGFTLASANLAVMVVVVAFYLFYYPAAMRYEDAKLERIFGDEWREWSSDPAIFPTGLHWRADIDVEWNWRQSLLRNGELPISIYLVVCAVVMLFRAGMV